MLQQQQCTACRADAPQVSSAEAEQFLQEIPEWEIVPEQGINRLQRSYGFANFSDALLFTNAVGQMAESEQHHPDIITRWGEVVLIWYTHKIKGLHRNDFICAARSDALYKN